MKCRNCKCNGFLTDDDGKQFSWCHRYGDNLDIDEERYCSDYTPATNADRIRAMTDEELASLLQPICPPIPHCPDEPPHNCRKCVFNWLRQEVTP